MLELDGAQGEGGGQVLRTALALSLCPQVRRSHGRHGPLAAFLR